MNCIHCGATKERYSKELTTEEIKKVIDELAHIRVRFFAVTGGEPLLRRDLLEVLEYASKKGIKTGIATNGFLINEEMAHKIGNIKVSSVQISLDGTESTHNEIRQNKESFQRVVNAIRLLKKEKIPILSVATTITPLNINDLASLKNILINLGIKLWRIGIIMPIGRAEGNNLLLTAKQLKNLLNFVTNNKDKIEIKIAENLPFLGDFEKKIRKEPLVCPVGFMACCIGVDGHIRGCPEQQDTEENREGSILEKTFLEIWKNGFKRYRNREIINKDEKCLNCKKKLECYGGCWVMRSNKTNCIYDLLRD